MKSTKKRRAYSRIGIRVRTRKDKSLPLRKETYYYAIIPYMYTSLFDGGPNKMGWDEAPRGGNRIDNKNEMKSSHDLRCYVLLCFV